jgi:two-component system LytT family response regulator
MKILIIDNEKNLRSSLKQMIADCGIVHIEIDEADGVVSGIQKIKHFQPEIVFLDIEMEDGTGFDLLKNLESISFQLIFTTAFNQYAIKAFKFSAIDYLLKPLDQEELSLALNKAILAIKKNKMSDQLGVLMEQLGVVPNTEKKIVLKDIDNTHFVKIKDILYCEAEGTYTRFYLTNKPPIFVSKNLKEYADILEPLGFIRTHHSFLANPEKITRFDKSDGGLLVLEGEKSIPLSQRKKEMVLKLLEKK